MRLGKTKTAFTKARRRGSQKPTARARKNSQKSPVFLAKISYNLRTPLNVIIGFSEILRHEKAGRINAEQREYLNDIIASAKDVLHLIKKTAEHSKKRG